MPQAAVSDLLIAEHLGSIDEVKVSAYNRRPKTRAEFKLHPEMGPSAYEGNIDDAAVVLLLSNPGFDKTSSSEDHGFKRNGWPLSGLHPEAPAGLNKWWSDRLRWLIEEFGVERISNSIACLQLTPWASEKFDSSLRLPSRALLLEAASLCAARGAVMVVMRSERLWLEAQSLASSPLRFRVRNRRASYVSPGNLAPDAWAALTAAIRAA
ncbi:hypothetical protein FN976_11070 [Caenimonas sedimenti]|uniref:Uracil-DNA glycosylase-like domain-containing protein n=1 Tax=Caenimonas sedimenti TaxID=2596921 RepID=A0A562ZS81_9BURK|nr:hypothetical protein [Caenimonas sedimenti]TWO71449.1 hypothetical protein FN976_11070 [Caenimonas sedimenti]